MHFHIKEYNSNKKYTFSAFPIQKTFGTKFVFAVFCLFAVFSLRHGQPWVISYGNFVVLLFRMLHIMYQGNRHDCTSGEEGFFLPYLDMAVVFVM